MLLTFHTFPQTRRHLSVSVQSSRFGKPRLMIHIQPEGALQSFLQTTFNHVPVSSSLHSVLTRFCVCVWIVLYANSEQSKQTALWVMCLKAVSHVVCSARVFSFSFFLCPGGGGENTDYSHLHSERKAWIFISVVRYGGLKWKKKTTQAWSGTKKM